MLSKAGLTLPTLNGYNIGSAPLAQLVEQLTLNQRVAGSSPARRTIFEANFPHFLWFSFQLLSMLSSLLDKIRDFSLNFA